jgi:TolB protein
MQFKKKLGYIALGGVLLGGSLALPLSGAVLLITVWAQAPQQAQITFETDRDGNNEIYVMDTDENNPRNLTNNPAEDRMPAWSPDGRQIAFSSNRNGNPEIYVMDASGNNPRNLTNNPAIDRVPTWSPDGQKIAFASNRDGNFEIYVMDASGNNPRNLTNNPADDFFPAWFGPAFGRPVSPAEKQPTVWGEIKRR